MHICIEFYPNIIYPESERALEKALKKCDLTELKKLILTVKDYSRKNPCISARGQKLLHFAAMSGQMQICEKILGNVANKYPKDNRGKIPLHYASELGILIYACY